MTFAVDCSLSQAKTQIARVLLSNASQQPVQRCQLAQRDMAFLGGIKWEIVHASLESLKNEGAIRMERHLIIINKELLNKVAGSDNI